MPRPRHDEGPSAVVRLESAFFDELQTTPFQRITVSAIVKSARLNRNSFYYHYTDLDDLAQSAVANLLVTDIPRLIAEGFGTESAQVTEAIASAIRDDRLRRMLAVTGPNSTAELQDMLKRAIVDVWLNVFGLEHDDLDAQATATIHFTLGGLLELLSRIDPQDPLTALMLARDLPIRHASAKIMSDTLREAAS